MWRCSSITSLTGEPLSSDSICIRLQNTILCPCVCEHKRFIWLVLSARDAPLRPKYGNESTYFPYHITVDIPDIACPKVSLSFIALIYRLRRIRSMLCWLCICCSQVCDNQTDCLSAVFPPAPQPDDGQDRHVQRHGRRL